MPECIFCNIATGKTRSTFLSQDDRCYVIRDIHPAAPTHLLVIPKAHVTSLTGDSPRHAALLGHLLSVGAQMAQEEQVTATGYRLVVNQGPDAGQGVAHLHVHVLGGKRLPALG